MKFLIVLLGLTFSSSTYAGDLLGLKNLFQETFHSLYVPRFCNQNIARFVAEAKKRNIDLSNSSVVKIEGGGFLNVSGFYTRESPNEWKMLGYFHYVLIVDGLVFDFDLAKPVILPLEKYVRLQFTPPVLPFVIFGIKYVPSEELKWWKVSFFETSPFAQLKTILKKSGTLGEFVSLENITSVPRVNP